MMRKGTRAVDRYVVVWTGVAGLIVVTGLVRLVAWSPSVAVSAWVGGATLVLTVWMCRLPAEEPIRWRLIVSRSVTWPTFAVASLGLFVTSHWSDALLLSAGALFAAWRARIASSDRRSAPPGVSALRDPGSQTFTSLARAAADAVLPVTDVLTDEDLCMAWRSSYVALERATGPATRLRAVEFRRLLLDELDRRDPVGLQAWLDSGARAAGGPERFLRRTDGSADLRRDQPS